MFEGINTWPKRQVKNLVASPDKDKNCFHIHETVVVGKKKNKCFAQKKMWN